MKAPNGNGHDGVSTSGPALVTAEKAKELGLVETPPSKAKARDPAPRINGDDDEHGGIPDHYKDTEAELLELFIGANGEDLRFVHETHKWLKWTGDRWLEDTTRLPFSLSYSVCRQNAAGIGPDRDSLRRWMLSAKTRANVVSLAGDDRRIATTSDIWDRDPDCVTCEAGKQQQKAGVTVNLATGESFAPRRANYISKATSVVPVRGEHPLWTSALNIAFEEDKELIAYFQRAMGYSLTAHINEEVMFFCYGTGGNLKGTTINTCAKAMGSYHVSASMETFIDSKLDRHPTELAKLRGARLVTAVETTAGRSWNEARIKQVTGRDPVDARFMRGDFFTYDPTFKLWVSGNHKPSLRNVDPAISGVGCN
jgi:putative DNA primase/helicase